MRTLPLRTLLLAMLPGAVFAGQDTRSYQPPPELPDTAAATLGKSLAASTAHRAHVWRDTPPVNPDATINAYVQIPRGERRKFEFDMGANRRAIDRVIPESAGGYPVPYG